jgi:hypothetical protein
MLHDDDLDAAVGAAIVTQAQADSLREFAVKRRSTGVAERADEERFRFMRGFNDIFFAIGVALLGVGLVLFAGMNFANPLVCGLSAFAMWGLAELLVRRMRLVLPGIVIVGFFVMFVVVTIPPLPVGIGPRSFGPTPGGNVVNEFFAFGNVPWMAINAVIASLAAFGFYLRFRFPFALLIVAAGAVCGFVLGANQFLFAGLPLGRMLLTLLSGVAVFAIAMRFDLSDRLRATRRSDCAFWLHVLAAPLLVHSLIGLVSLSTSQAGNVMSLAIIAIAGLLTVVALVIDRRALLVSALVYVGSAIAIALSNASMNRASVLIATLVILGLLVLALGVGWAPLRRRVVSLLSPQFVDRLPPVVPA